ncbi:Cupin [compost metagenome]
MDLLGEVLLSLKIEANSVGIFNCGEPWGMAVPATTSANAYTFCAIDKPFWLMLDGQQPQCLQPGDAALILHGRAFSFASSRDASCIPLADYWERNNLPRLTPGSRQGAPLRGLQLGESPHDARVLTMGLIIGGATDNHLLRVLPDLIALRGSASGLFPWLPSLLEFLAAEQTSAIPGYTATASRLAELIFTSFIRAHSLSTVGQQRNWLSGLRDPRISQALVAMHSRPAEAWTVEKLAELAGMSRFSFGRLFTKRTGQSPIDYLIECRMQLAAELLLDGRVSIALIAERVGYQSERAFRELFKKRFGMSPRSYAKQQDEENVRGSA